jgi:hypothetical protein
MTLVTHIKPHILALEFVARLREALTPAQWREMRLRNRDETHPSVCHSHDFLDANDILNAALTHLNGDIEPDIEDEETQKLWNAAWEIAMPRLTAAPPKGSRN